MTRASLLLLAALLARTAPAAEPAPRVLDWRDPSPAAHPRLFVEPGAWADVRARLGGKPASAKFAAFPPTGHPDAAVLLFLATGLDSAGADMVVENDPASRLEDAVGSAKPDRPDLHRVIADLAAADLLLGWDKVPPEYAVRLRRAAAQLGYELADPKGRRPASPGGVSASAAQVWSAVTLEMIAALLPTHPAAAEWQFAAGVRLADHPLPRLNPTSGGFVNISPADLAPYLLHELLLARRKPDAVPDPALRELLLSLVRRSTPYDSVRNARTLFGSPATGPRGTAVFAWAAAVFARSDRALSTELAWWHEQFGERHESDLPGPVAEPAVITLQLTDPARRGLPPRLKSAVVPGFGVIVRDDAPSPAELYVALPEPAEGRLAMQYFHQAFPSITAEWLPAKPKPGTEHAAAELRVMRFAEYVSAEADGVRRQALIVKSPVGAAPQYVLLRWRMPKTDGRLRLLVPGDVFSDEAGQLSGLYDRLGHAVTARLVTPAEAKPAAKTFAAGDAGIDHHEVGFDLKAAEDIRLLTYPYQAGNPRPVLTPIADGAGVEVKARGSTQWVFLSDKPVKFESTTADFEGTAGAVREAPAVTSVQIFGGGRARSRGWTVATDGHLSVLQRGPGTLLVESDGPAQKVSITWKRVGRAIPEAEIDGRPLAVRHEEETITFEIPEGHHQLRIDFDR
jgi:hypothetical protein